MREWYVKKCNNNNNICRLPLDFKGWIGFKEEEEAEERRRRRRKDWLGCVRVIRLMAKLDLHICNRSYNKNEKSGVGTSIWIYGHK